ncbi:biotin/lipoate A/B protein ligase family protein [Conexibacter sp. S30A1]|uniref:lipoate--protein ligase family protein n=1 Tax=Conexibacter sp. S30A1 TaxID=2937800 RepID=UPI00200EC29F|nr:biotin/lipoate A/B protein ligase family protein [Conexibacter sp. S30A1]
MVQATLRVIDAGAVGAERSQALWHGLADAMGPADAPVLSFCRPAEPYVGIGYHRRLDELDRAACARLGLPILRRQIGGGPVYLDSDQLFFQLTLPASSAPSGVLRLYGELLGPAVQALRALGVDAALAGVNDIVAGGRKVSGTGAGQIGEAVTVVGNVMFAFDHERMSEVLAFPDEAMRADFLCLLRANLGTLPDLDPTALKQSLVSAYAAALGREPVRDLLRSDELAAIKRWDERLRDSSWLEGPALAATPGRQVKVRAGTWLYDGESDGLRVRVRVEEGLIAEARVTAPWLSGAAAGLARALVGVAARPHSVAASMDRFEHEGERVLAALAPGLVVR